MFHNTIFYRNFFKCGLCGWCLECFWTGLGSLFSFKNKRLMCQTSLWMFPIYGLAACFTPISTKLRKCHTAIRGSIYMTFIFFAEFITGSFLKRFDACPWDYSKSKLNYKGVIRFDYAPAWFLCGLLFEQLMGISKKN